MSNPAPQPDMAWLLRRLLEAVKGAACGLEGRWRWFGAPMLLLTWFRTRRERREAAEAMAAVQGLLEAFLGLLEDFRAGRLVAEDAPPDEAGGGSVRAVAAPSAVDTPDRGERRGARRPRAAVAAMGPVAAPVDGCGNAQRVAIAPPHRAPACAGITGTRFGGMTGTGIAGLLARRARSPPRRDFEKRADCLRGSLRR